MRKLFATVATIVVAFNLSAQNVKIPYFNTLTYNEICGDQACHPTIGSWFQIAGDGYLWDGDLNEILGHRYGRNTTIHNNEKCVAVPPTEKDIMRIAKKNVSGTLDVKKRKEFSSKVNADLGRTVAAVVTLPVDLKAKLLLQLSRTLDASTNSLIDLEFEVIQLKSEYIASQVNACLYSAPKKERVVVGVGALSVSGSWTSNTLGEVFRNFEADATVAALLTGDVKAKYEESKKKILQAKFDKYTYIINASVKTRS